MNPVKQTSAGQAKGIRACPVCGSGQVFPLRQRQVDSDSWLLHMQCPNCFTWRDVTVDMKTVNQLGCDLCREQEALRQQLDRLEHRHMQEAAESFISALYSNHIQPIDF